MLRATRGLRLGTRSISNYYKVFPNTLSNGPPPEGKFEIDLKKLKNEYIQAQRESHPDVAGGDSQVSSAELSTAYRALANPITRAEHILSLKGQNPLEEGVASLDDEDLLMEIMMSREYVSEAESKEDLGPLIEDTNMKFDSTEKDMARALEKDDVQEAQAQLIKLTYLSKLQQAIEQKLEELE